MIYSDWVAIFCPSVHPKYGDNIQAQMTQEIQQQKLLYFNRVPSGLMFGEIKWNW
jgi:hypothetical protein